MAGWGGSALTVAAAAAAAAALVLLWAALAALRRGRALRGGAGLAAALALLGASGTLAMVALGTHGYRALTREEVAALVDVEPRGPRRFLARVRLPDGRAAAYEIAGDALYVDARVLKWKPWAQLLGLHTAYALDRIGGRYRDLASERAGPRTVYRIAPRSGPDLFDLRRRHAFLAPLVDAEYGSAVFVPVEGRGRFEIRVGLTGLLARPVPARGEAEAQRRR